MMWSESDSNYKKLPEISAENVDLYRSNDFVADSLETALASSVKISADGKITIQNIGFVGDRYIHPELQLPDLKERCNVATTEDLYHLSTLLADDDTDPITAKTFCPPDVDNTRALQAKNTHTGHPWDTTALLPKRNQDKPTRHTIVAAGEQSEISQISREKMEGVEHSQSVEKIKYDEKPTTARNYSLHLKFTNSTKAKSQSMNYMSSSSNDEPLDTGRSAASTDRWKAPEKDVGFMWLKLFAVKRDTLLYLRKPKSVPKIQSPKRVKVFHVFSAILNFLSKYRYTYANFILLCNLFYIAFAMFDLYMNDTVERRYMLKMRSSGFLLKCYYYIMRLLDMPIF